jgi:hypothetical protein
VGRSRPASPHGAAPAAEFSWRQPPLVVRVEPGGPDDRPVELERVRQTPDDRTLGAFGRVYDAEAEIKLLDDAGRLAARQARTRQVLDALFARLEEQRGQVLPKSPIGVAVGYTLGNRAALSRYTEAGFLAIDNYASERALRAVAIGRKNNLFAGSDGGGRSVAILYSVVGTCRRLGLDPFAYLDVFNRLPSRVAVHPDDLLPKPPGQH